jgi:hypothetical protein
MKHILRNILIIFVLYCIVPVAAQEIPSAELATAEDFLYQKFTELYKSPDDAEKVEINSLILDEFEKLLKDPMSFNYPFDSLRWTGRIYSPDQRVRIITWNIPAVDGTHIYYGFIQYCQKKEKPCLVFRLHDRSLDITNPESAVLSAERWWGALYYKILMNRYKGKRVYTIIGLDMNDRYSNKKVIDIITFEDNYDPVFGRPAFRVEGKLKNRVIFEYAEDVVMTVRYNEMNKMIVFDHLSPIDPALRNNPRFYAPDSSYDGFRFRKGIWEYFPDIDVRNP